jgi:hypothetical protein
MRTSPSVPALPSVLGMYAFAAATFIVAAHMAHWYGNAQSALVLFPLVLIFGGLAQFYAGAWSLRTSDAVALAMHCTWGSFWTAYGILELLYSTGHGSKVWRFGFFQTADRRCSDMHRATRLVPLFLSFVLMLAVGLALAAAVPGSKASTMKTVTKTAKSSAATSKSAAKSMKKASAKKMSHVLASAEDLSGTITAVDPSVKEVTMVASNGVPYDFQLTRKTQVKLSNEKIGMNELASESHKQATVRFIPTSRGNLAESIQISAS